MPTDSQPRFVNLNRTRVQVLDPQGRPIFVFPFHEGVGRARRADAVYVVEGEHWRRFVSDAGPLYPFPSPTHYGLETFPELRVQRDSGEQRTLSGAAAEPASALVGSVQDLAAGLGRFRAKGDLIRQGKKVVEDPETGRTYLIDDPGAPAGAREEMRKSVFDYLTDLGVNSVQDFRALSDEVLLAIPGLGSAQLSMLRRNVEIYFSQVAKAEREGNPLPETKFLDLITDDDPPEGAD